MAGSHPSEQLRLIGRPQAPPEEYTFCDSSVVPPQYVSVWYDRPDDPGVHPPECVVVLYGQGPRDEELLTMRERTYNLPGNSKLAEQVDIKEGASGMITHQEHLTSDPREQGPSAALDRARRMAWHVLQLARQPKKES